MSTLLKAQNQNAAKASLKGKGKRKAEAMDVDEDGLANAPAAKKMKNKQRVLMLSSRGVTHRMRHLMGDLEALLPHVKKGAFIIVCLYVYTDWREQTRNSTPKTNSHSCLNSPTLTTVTTLCTLRHEGMKTCICGQQKRRTARA